MSRGKYRQRAQSRGRKHQEELGQRQAAERVKAQEDQRQEEQRAMQAAKLRDEITQLETDAQQQVQSEVDNLVLEVHELEVALAAFTPQRSASRSRRQGKRIQRLAAAAGQYPLEFLEDVTREALEEPDVWVKSAGTYNNLDIPSSVSRRFEEMRRRKARLHHAARKS